MIFARRYVSVALVVEIVDMTISLTILVLFLALHENSSSNSPER